MLLSQRTIVLLAVGAVWYLMAGAWGGFFWVGVAHNIILLMGCVVDWRLLREYGSHGSERLTARRVVRPVLSLGAANVVQLIVRNAGQQDLELEVLDEPPVDFVVDGREFRLRIESGGTSRLSYHATPRQRGEFRFESAHVRCRTRLGLVVRRRAFDLQHTVRVYPNLLQTQEHGLLARRNRLTQMGLRTQRLHGRGMEFARLREYVPGDDLRKVDWKASARRGSLVTREYDVERSQSILLLLDSGRTMAGVPNLSYGFVGPDTVASRPNVGAAPLTKLDHAINTCVMLTYVAVQGDDRVGLMAFADETLRYVAPGKGRAQMFRVTDTLAGLQPRLTESNYRAAFRGAAQRVRKRSLVIVFTDLIDPDSSERLIANLRTLLRKHLVLCVALSDYELPELLNRAPESVDDLYQQTVAASILHDRRRALKSLQRQGVIVLDATPRDLTVTVVNKYLEIKREGRV